MIFPSKQRSFKKVEANEEEFCPLLPVVANIEPTSNPQGLSRWSSGKESACQSRRYKRYLFDAWVGKIPWRRKWQPTPVFLPEESHGQRSLAGPSPWGRKESDMTERTHIPALKFVHFTYTIK